MTRTFIELSFSSDPNSRRYTYHTDDSVGIGDLMEVNTPNGTLLQLPVLAILDEAPPFPTKPASKV